MKLVFILLLLLVDAIGTVIAWQMTFLLRVKSGLFETPLPIETVMPVILLTLFWWILFALRGMYRTPLAISRFDVVVRCFSSFIIGILIIFVLTSDVNDPINSNRFFLLHYGVIAFILVSVGRLVVRMLQRWMRWKRKGLYRALIVGFNDVGKQLHDQLHNFPVWGFQVVGFIDDEIPDGEHLNRKVLGGKSDLSGIVESQKVQFVLIAPEKQSRKEQLEIFDSCNSPRTRFMIVPDYNQMVSGLVKNIEIHGLPLIEVMPLAVSLRIRIVKRLMDIIAGVIISVLVLIITPIIGLLIKIDSKGAVFYRQKHVGRLGVEFTLFKFRTTKDNQQVTRIGRILHKTHMYELPQIFNVLIGRMSLVGPRPERLELVEKLQDEIPLYKRRIRVRPGITGWAQVRYRYKESFEDIVEETKYDLFYIDHISPALDLKIILAT
ncbi:MAG: exopolysaccharide biosynthesis polyprenyl glycosylphosphotransferase, partial [Calditrichaeota bacterium]|nr:exopolysaccharide biosynthesis polyprenyl glycosylphosphotransferase [Calditrichota bacterium]